MGPDHDASAEQRLRAVLSRLAELADLRERLEYELVTLVNQLGVSWDRIGEAHEPPISRQAARKRYSHPKRRRRR